MRLFIIAIATLISTSAVAQTLVYHDGKEWKPFIEPRAFVDGEGELWPDAVRKAIEAGAWTDTELSKYGIATVDPAVTPEGKQPVGDVTYIERDGKVVEQREYADVQIEPVLTLEQKLNSIGVTLDELREGLAGK